MAEDVSKNNSAAVKEKIEASSSQRKGTDPLPQLEIELSRLRELDHRCLDVEDLKTEKNRWVVNDTALLKLCETVYTNSRNNWLRSSFPELMTELDEIKSTVETRSNSQIKSSRTAIEKWAQRFVEPESPDNADMQTFIMAMQTEECVSQAAHDERMKKNHEMKLRNQEQMEKLKAICDNFNKFVLEVLSRFSWSKAVKSSVNENNRQLTIFSGRLDKRITTYWNALEKEVVDKRIAAQTQEEQRKLHQKSAENLNLKDKADRVDSLTKECDMLRESLRQRETDFSKKQAELQRKVDSQDADIERMRNENVDMKAKNGKLEDELKEYRGPIKTQSQSSVSAMKPQSQSSQHTVGSHQKFALGEP